MSVLVYSVEVMSGCFFSSEVIPWIRNLYVVDTRRL